MKIWAHRGCSQMYPENTLTAFQKAAELLEKGLTGIELDIQLTRDGYMVVIHDERVDRTTDGTGMVKDYTLEGIRQLKIEAGNGNYERIPTMEEVLDLLDKPMRAGLRLNIELKNSMVPYDGMEQKIVELVHSRGLQNKVVYSSFSALSLDKLRKLDPETEIGILDTKVSDCLYKLKGGCGANALHPNSGWIDLPREELAGYTVRAWGGGHLFPMRCMLGRRMNLDKQAEKGITDVFLNEPEQYL